VRAPSGIGVGGTDTLPLRHTANSRSASMCSLRLIPDRRGGEQPLQSSEMLAFGHPSGDGLDKGLSPGPRLPPRDRRWGLFGHGVAQVAINRVAVAARLAVAGTLRPRGSRGAPLPHQAMAGPGTRRPCCQADDSRRCLDMLRDLTGSLMYGVGTSWMPLPERPMQSRSPARGFWGAGTSPAVRGGPSVG
jgi:hypothetical protein